MLYNLILSRSEAGQTIAEWIEYAATAIEILAVVIIVLSIFASVIRYLGQRVRGQVGDNPYRDLKGRLGRSMLLGLEILVLPILCAPLPWTRRCKASRSWVFWY